jgi:5-methylcytosine-specific restriction protein A
MAEYEQLGRDAFLRKHGYGRARQYYLRGPDGQLYDSKAITGVAYGLQFPQHGPLRAAEFSGGEATVKTVLDGLGFDVVPLTAAGHHLQEREARNPPWIRDELILALDLYMRLKGQTFGHDAPEIAECSQLLGRLQDRLGARGATTLRNPNGVYMKLMNFRRFDPDFIQAGKTGLARGNRLEDEVWVTFGGDLRRLASVAQAIRRQIGGDGVSLRDRASAIGEEDDEFEAPEGKLLTRPDVRLR